MKRWGILYWNAFSYRTIMGFLRPKGEREAMFKRIAAEVGAQSVLELCCGPADLFTALPGNAYLGIDKNPAFTRPLNRRGLQVRQGDILTVDWPSAECLVIVDSLYHFIGRMHLLLERIKSYPCRRVIISEPVHNVLTRLPAWLRPLAGWVTRVNGKYYSQRYTEADLQQLLTGCGFQKTFRIGHNCIGVWDRC